MTPPIGSRALASAMLMSVLIVATPTAAESSPLEQAAGPETFHVAKTGHELARGSATAPLRTIEAAVRRASSGDRIVVHGGSYHEEIDIPAGKSLSISNAPGSRVWLEGSREVTSWRSEGGVYVHTGWREEFDSSPTYHWGEPDNPGEDWSFIDPNHPMAAHPDQMWIGGKRLKQVASRSAVRPGTFFVDDAGDRLYLGSDPSGRSVRASNMAKAVSIQGSGSSISGIGVRRFAPSVPHMGAVTIEAPGVTLSNMRIEGNATTGLHVSASNATLKNLRLTRNGMLGAGATYADDLRVIGLNVRNNNTERFNYSPVAGGFKIDRTRGVLVRDSEFVNNAGTGLWIDESSYSIGVFNTTSRNNLRHGLSLEISARAVVGDNVIAGNAGDGIKVNNTSGVALWNNTIIDNGRPVNIVQDDRDPSDPGTPGRDPRQPRPDPTMTWINGPVQVHNNILTAAKDGNCLLCVEDFSERFSAKQLGIHSSGNIYHRRDRSSPSWAVVWSVGAGDPDVYNTVREFHRATGEESRHADLIGKAAVTKSLRATKHVKKLTGAVAERLPSDLARLLGQRAGARHLGAWF